MTINVNFEVDDSLSLRDIGLLAVILSMKDDYINEQILTGLLPNNSRRSIRSAIKVLTRSGYLKRYIQRDDKGRICGTIWEVNSSPNA